jgi:hypothetical protein
VLSLGVALGNQFLVQHDLRNAAAVAQIEKDQVAVIATPVHPAHQHNRLSCVGGAQFAACVRSFEISLKIEHCSCPLLAKNLLF